MSISGVFGSAAAANQNVKVVGSGVRSANGSTFYPGPVGGWPRPEMSCLIPANTLIPGGYLRVNYEFSNSGTGSLFYTQLAGKPIGATYSVSGNASYRGSLFIRNVDNRQLIATTGASDGVQTPLTSLSCDMSLEQMFQIYSNGPIQLNSWSVEAHNPSATAVPVSILPGRKIFYGINAHIDEGNGPTIANRISAMKVLGFNVLRVSWFGTQHSSGGVLATTWIQDMASAFAADTSSLNLNMMVMVSCGPGSFTTEADAYSAGFAQGSAAAFLLGSKGVQLYELGNEVDAATNIRRTSVTQGTVLDDFSLSSTVTWAAWRGNMRGCYDGIKSVQPTAQVGSNAFTNASLWASDALWNGVDPQGGTSNPQVRWDWTNWHFYTEEDATNIPFAPGNSNFNLLQHLHNAYQRPIFITEWNPAEGTASTKTKINTWLTTWYGQQNAYNIGGVVWFSWFDGPYNIAITSSPSIVNSVGAALVRFISANPALK